MRWLVLFLLLLKADVSGGANLLESLDTSSPRATFSSFWGLTEKAAHDISVYRASPSRATQAPVFRIGEQASGLFDLSNVPPASRREAGAEAFYLLWEVMSRLELPDPSEIPDAGSGEAEDGEAKRMGRWRLPGTAITIARVENGARAGEFLFTADTVRGARRSYETLRELPYRRPMPAPDVYRLTQSLTGWMIPLAWGESLPDWANATVLDQLLWKWIALLVLFGLAFGFVLAILRWARRGVWEASLHSYLRRLSTPLAILAFVPLLQFLATYQLNVTGEAADAPFYVLELAHGLAVVWFIWLTMSWIGEVIIASPRISARSLDAHLIRLATRSVGILAILVLVFRVAHELGIPVYGLVTGAGVGGLAIALAARSTLENFMGTLNLYADRPVRVGELCRYGEDPAPDWQRVGTVEEIGLRSTRIRGLDRTITTIPNAEFSNMHIVNLTERDQRLLRTVLQLRYETTPEQMRYVLAKLRELLLGHPKVSPDPARVRFVGYGPYSKDVEVNCYLRCQGQNVFLAIQEDVLLRIDDIVRSAGTGFAFPSRTTYHARDAGLDADLRGEAEALVESWRARNKLPFPEFEEEERERLEDTLEYPPKGSPDHTSSGGPSAPPPAEPKVNG